MLSGKHDKAKLRSRKQRDLLGKPAQVQSNKRQCLQIFKDEIAIARRVHRIGRRRGKSQLACRNRAIESERCSGNSS